MSQSSNSRSSKSGPALDRDRTKLTEFGFRSSKQPKKAGFFDRLLGGFKSDEDAPAGNAQTTSRSNSNTTNGGGYPKTGSSPDAQNDSIAFNPASASPTPPAVQSPQSPPPLQSLAPSREMWMSDKNCSVCYDCQLPFHFWRRRHHCRLCGQIFCQSCSDLTVDGRRYQMKDGQVRVCKHCYNLDKNYQASGYGGGGTAMNPPGLERGASGAIASPIQQIPPASSRDSARKDSPAQQSSSVAAGTPSTLGRLPPPSLQPGAAAVGAAVSPALGAKSIQPHTLDGLSLISGSHHDPAAQLASSLTASGTSNYMDILRPGISSGGGSLPSLGAAVEDDPEMQIPTGTTPSNKYKRRTLKRSTMERGAGIALNFGAMAEERAGNNTSPAFKSNATHTRDSATPTKPPTGAREKQDGNAASVPSVSPDAVEPEASDSNAEGSSAGAFAAAAAAPPGSLPAVLSNLAASQKRGSTASDTEEEEDDEFHNPTVHSEDEEYGDGEEDDGYLAAQQQQQARSGSGSGETTGTAGAILPAKEPGSDPPSEAVSPEPANVKQPQQQQAHTPSTPASSTRNGGVAGDPVSPAGAIYQPPTPASAPRGASTTAAGNTSQALASHAALQQAQLAEQQAEIQALTAARARLAKVNRAHLLFVIASLVSSWKVGENWVGILMQLAEAVVSKLSVEPNKRVRWAMLSHAQTVSLLRREDPSASPHPAVLHAAAAPPPGLVDDYMDVLPYLKIKTIPGGVPGECKLIHGVAFRKNVAHKKMCSYIVKPRVLLLNCALEYQRIENRLSSIDTVLEQEKEYITLQVSKILRWKPDVVVVEKSVSRLAQELLREAGVTLVLNVAPSLMARLARATQAQPIVPANDYVDKCAAMGTCGRFSVESYIAAPSQQQQQDGKGVNLASPPHLPSAVHAGSAAGGLPPVHSSPSSSSSLSSAARGEKVMLMSFSECASDLHHTVLLRGESELVLKRIKYIFRIIVHVAYHLSLETALLFDTCATYTDAVWEKLQANYHNRVAQLFGKSSEVATIFLNKNLRARLSSASADEAAAADAAADLPSPPSFSPPSSLPPPLPSTPAPMRPGFGIPLSASPFVEMSLVPVPAAVLDARNRLGLPTLAATAASSPPTSPIAGGSGIQAGSAAPVAAEEKLAPLLWIHDTILFGSTWFSSAFQCFPPECKGIQFYADTDKTLGQFLLENCFDLKLRCLNEKCSKDVLRHTLAYTHNQGRLVITVKKIRKKAAGGSSGGATGPPPAHTRDVSVLFDGRAFTGLGSTSNGVASPPAIVPPTSPASPGAAGGVSPFGSTALSSYSTGSSSSAVGVHARHPLDHPTEIMMWSRCKVCCRRVTPYMPMSDPTYKLSFGSFLDLFFHNAAATSRTGGCNHEIAKNHVRIFGYVGLMASFEWEPFKSFQIVTVPRLAPALAVVLPSAAAAAAAAASIGVANAYSLAAVARAGAASLPQFPSFSFSGGISGLVTANETGSSVYFAACTPASFPARWATALARFNQVSALVFSAFLVRIAEIDAVLELPSHRGLLRILQRKVARERDRFMPYVQGLTAATQVTLNGTKTSSNNSGSATATPATVGETVKSSMQQAAEPETSLAGSVPAAASAPGPNTAVTMSGSPVSPGAALAPLHVAFDNMDLYRLQRRLLLNFLAWNNKLSDLAAVFFPKNVAPEGGNKAPKSWWAGLGSDSSTNSHNAKASAQSKDSHARDLNRASASDTTISGSPADSRRVSAANAAAPGPMLTTTPPSGTSPHETEMSPLGASAEPVAGESNGSAANGSSHVGGGDATTENAAEPTLSEMLVGHMRAPPPPAAEGTTGAEGEKAIENSNTANGTQATVDQPVAGTGAAGSRAKSNTDTQAPPATLGTSSSLDGLRESWTHTSTAGGSARISIPPRLTPSQSFSSYPSASPTSGTATTNASSTAAAKPEKKAEFSFRDVFGKLGMDWLKGGSTGPSESSGGAGSSMLVTGEALAAHSPNLGADSFDAFKDPPHLGVPPSVPPLYVPVHDDQPSSIIAYTLASLEHLQAVGRLRVNEMKILQQVQSWIAHEEEAAITIEETFEELSSSHTPSATQGAHAENTPQDAPSTPARSPARSVMSSPSGVPRRAVPLPYEPPTLGMPLQSAPANSGFNTPARSSGALEATAAGDSNAEIKSGTTTSASAEPPSAISASESSGASLPPPAGGLHHSFSEHAVSLLFPNSLNAHASLPQNVPPSIPQHLTASSLLGFDPIRDRLDIVEANMLRFNPEAATASSNAAGTGAQTSSSESVPMNFKYQFEDSGLGGALAGVLHHDALVGAGLDATVAAAAAAAAAGTPAGSSTPASSLPSASPAPRGSISNMPGSSLLILRPRPPLRRAFWSAPHSVAQRITPLNSTLFVSLRWAATTLSSNLCASACDGRVYPAANPDPPF
jgi:hypothetical protein